MTRYRAVHRKRRWTVLPLLATCLALQLAACKKSGDEAEAAVVTVQAEKVEVGDIAEQIPADAVLSPLAQAAISPKISAPVKSFSVQRGSRVRAGQLLAVLENRDLAATALDNKGQLTAAEASYDIQTKAQVPEDVRKAQLDAAQSKAQRDLQASIVAARQKLFAEGAIAGRDLDTAKAQLAQAEATYAIAQNHLDSLQRVSRQATIRQSQGQLTSAKGKYLAAEAQVSYSEIRSPINGVVTDRPLFPGETASAGTALVTVMDTSALLAKVHVSQTVAQRLALGDTAQMSIPGVDDPVDAKVTLVSPALDPSSTTVEVWLRVENKDGAYKAGTPVRLKIRGRAVPGAIKVPLSSLLTATDGTKSVMTVGSDGVAHKKVVQVGINDGTDVQITQGISRNDTVITDGAYGLEDGTKVKVGKDEDDKGGAKD